MKEFGGISHRRGALHGEAATCRELPEPSRGSLGGGRGADAAGAQRAWGAPCAPACSPGRAPSCASAAVCLGSCQPPLPSSAVFIARDLEISGVPRHRGAAGGSRCLLPGAGAQQHCPPQPPRPSTPTHPRCSRARGSLRDPNPTGAVPGAPGGTKRPLSEMGLERYRLGREPPAPHARPLWVPPAPPHLSRPAPGPRCNKRAHLCGAAKQPRAAPVAWLKTPLAVLGNAPECQLQRQLWWALDLYGQ